MFPTRWKLVAYAIAIVLGCSMAAPNLLSPAQLAALPDWLPKRQVTLGLDLKGGSHLVLEIDSRALLRERLESIADRARAALRHASIMNAEIVVAADAVTVRRGAGEQRGDVAAVLRAMGAPDLEVARLSDGAVQVKPAAATLRSWSGSAVEQSLEIVRRRVDGVGVAEPTIQALGPDRILVQLPGVHDSGRIRQLLGSTAKLGFHMVGTVEQAGQALQGFTTLPGSNDNARHVVERRPSLQGDRLIDAAAGFDQRTGQPVVTFRFDSIGAKRFAEITQANVGRSFAIVLDGKVLSAPVIQEPITGGSGQISGHFTTAETTSLAALLRAGALPVPLTVVEERTVGADLGSDAIRMGATTGVIGFAFVCAFMVALYGRWGWVANLALALNVALTFAALAMLGVTLTLPGIAGIVLGIGLAVDANVLINERIREETRAGKGAAAALDRGFGRAYATIVDSNVTSLIATALLFWFGSGPVRGFAVTMALGIAISMFTAVSVVKAIMAIWLRWRRPRQFVIEPLFAIAALSRVPAFRFMRARYFGIGLSILLSLASVGLFVKPGLNYGIDFRGGMLLEVQSERPVELSQMRAAVDAIGLGDVALQDLGDPRTVLIRIERQLGDDAAQMRAVDRVKAEMARAAPETEFARVEVVGPKVSGELTRTGILAVLFASLAMLIYIWARFEWPFAIGAIATLALDTTKTVGFFALTGLDFNLTAIAALLTLIGYSVNDKVVVYDRMRENLRLFKTLSLRDLIDLSINQTLARSLYTSATAFLAMLPMAVWGGPAVESFAVPMLFGIAVAASSSIFIAAPILLFLGEYRLRRRGSAMKRDVSADAAT